MSSEHARTVEEYYRLVDAGDIEGLVALFAPDSVYCRPGYPPIEGHDGLRSFYEGTRVIESGRHTLERRVVDTGGDAIAVHGRFDGRLRDGSETSLRFADFFTFDAQGRFATRDTFFFSAMV